MRPITILLSFFFSLLVSGQGIPLKVEKIPRTSFSESEPSEPITVSKVLSNNSPKLSANRIGGEYAGSTEGNLSVSATGAAIYSIPITVPMGLQGVIPTLSINYNSQSGNGMAGYGWNLSGISVITRIGSTLYHDGNISEVNFTNTDRFSLDGQRLILKTGEYGKEGAIYETENFSHIKVTSIGTSPYGPKYFEVLYPDGSKAYYGQTDNSRSQSDYAITYWENPQGIRISYSYIRSGNAIFIDKITYGKQHNLVGDSEIRFFYKNRTRPEVAYVGGIRFENNLLLEKIQSFSKGQEFRTYTLNYGGSQNSLGYDRLMAVEESIGSNKRNPIQFSYSDTQEMFEHKSSTYNISISNISQENSQVVPLDMDGNRLTDFILYLTTGADAFKKIYLSDDYRDNSKSLILGTSLDEFSQIFPAQILIGQNKDIYPTSQGFVSVHTLNDRIKFKTYTKGPSISLYYQYEKEWKIPSYKNYIRCKSEDIGADADHMIVVEEKQPKKKIISGDFNGDGLTDIIGIILPYQFKECHWKPKYQGECMNDPDAQSLGYAPSERDKNCCECYEFNRGGNAYFIDLDSRKTTNYISDIGYFSNGITDEDNFLSYDMMGKGSSNIVHIRKGQIIIYAIKNNRLVFLWETSHSSISPRKQLLFGDYNGDGKIDILLPTENNSNRFVLLSNTGKGFDASEREYPFAYRTSYIETKEKDTNTSFWGWIDRRTVRYNVHHYHQLIPIDINNDGKTDIVETYSNRAPERFSDERKDTEITLYANISSGSFTRKGNKTLPNDDTVPHLVFSPSDKRNIFMDISVVSGNSIKAIHLEKNNKEDMLLNSVFQNGINQKISYKSASEHFPYEYPIESETRDTYRKGNGEQFPYIDLGDMPLVSIVSKIERTGGGLPPAEQQFKYAGAVSHLQGLGFLGFKSIGRSNWYATNSYENALYTHTKMNPQLRGAITTAFTTDYVQNYEISGPKNYTQKETYTYENQSDNNKIFKLKLIQKNTEDKLSGVNSSQHFYYNSDMNPTRVEISSGAFKNVEETTYIPNSQSPYLIGRVASKKTSNTIDGDTFTIEEQFSYQNNLITTKKVKGHNTGFQTENYTYDDVGNIIQKETINENGEKRSEQMEYDSSKRFLKKHTDFEGQTTLYQHNDYNGTLQQETNYLGQTTRYFYDAWGRLTQTTDFLNNNENISYESAPDGYAIITSADDQSYSNEAYNQFGLLTLSEERRHNGSLLSMRYQYDAQGRTIQESLPHYGSSPKGWIENTYDRYGRVTQITHPTGKTTQFTYNELITTVNDGTKTTISTKNTSGQVIKQEDPGGAITYTYYGNGNLKTSNYQGSVQRITQDGWGRKTALNDPSAGNYTYAYDGWGRITQETTPKGTTNYTYENQSDRIREKHISGSGTDMRVTYAYNGDKMLSSIELQNADGNNETYSYTYNSNKQVTSLTENKLNGSAVFTRNYTYDRFGRTQKEDYTAQAFGKKISTGISYGYSANILTAIRKNSGETIWGLGSVNEYDQPITFSKGKVYEEIQYNYQYVTNHSIRNDNTVLENKTYQFNPSKGLLNHRAYDFNEAKETFGYDNLDRLTSWSGTDGTQQAQTYDARGRIEQNNLLGRYQYNSNGYQQSKLITNEMGNAHYTEHTIPTIHYNAFKSPIEIKIDSPKSKDIISYQYDAFGSRAVSYYGGTQTEKTERRFQKYYSHDGIFEIKHDKSLNKTSFYIYLGGDAYSAPAVYSVEGDTQKYLYLHRDYLGSITLITDDEGNAVERRHFDAWGQITKYWNAQGQITIPEEGILLDRGYTSHEHLLSVGLIHMNGRLYDPLLHRFLQPDNYVQDPFNTQNFNRYGYVLNNPLLYTDPSGEISEGPNANQQRAWGTGISSLLYTVKENWPEIRDWLGRNARSVGGWFEKQYNSVSEWFKADTTPRTVAITPIQNNFQSQINTVPIQYNNIKDLEKNNFSKTKNASILLGSTLTFLIVDDVSVIGIADDPLIPVVGIGGAAIVTGIAIYEFTEIHYQNIVNLFAKEHSKNKRPSNWNKHTKPRSGRNSTKNRQKKDWKSNQNKKK